MVTKVSEEYRKKINDALAVAYLDTLGFRDSSATPDEHGEYPPLGGISLLLCVTAYTNAGLGFGTFERCSERWGLPAFIAHDDDDDAAPGDVGC